MNTYLNEYKAFHIAPYPHLVVNVHACASVIVVAIAAKGQLWGMLRK